VKNSGPSAWAAKRRAARLRGGEQPRRAGNSSGAAGRWCRGPAWSSWRARDLCARGRRDYASCGEGRHRAGRAALADVFAGDQPVVDVGDVDAKNPHPRIYVPRRPGTSAGRRPEVRLSISSSYNAAVVRVKGRAGDICGGRDCTLRRGSWRAAFAGRDARSFVAGPMRQQRVGDRVGRRRDERRAVGPGQRRAHAVAVDPFGVLELVVVDRQRVATRPAPRTRASAARTAAATAGWRRSGPASRARRPPRTARARRPPRPTHRPRRSPRGPSSDRRGSAADVRRARAPSCSASMITTGSVRG
jgi:hypothetical protein